MCKAMVCSILLNLPRRAGAAPLSARFLSFWEVFSPGPFCVSCWVLHLQLLPVQSLSNHLLNTCVLVVYSGSERNFGRGTKRFCIFVVFFVRRGKTPRTFWTHQHVFKSSFWLQFLFPGYPIPVQLPFFFVLFGSLFFFSTWIVYFPYF